jgi:putative MATE family efflux protein
MVNAITPVVAHNAGAGQRETCGEVLGHGVMLTLAAGGVALWALAAATPLAHPLLDGMAGPKVGAIATTYIAIRLLGSPFFLLLLCGNKFLIGVHHTRPIAGVAVATGLLQAALSYGLGLGTLGLPAGGAAGIAMAYAVAQVCGAAAILAICRRGATGRRYRTRLWPDPLRRELLAKLLAIGVPLGGAQLFSSSSYLILTFVAAHLGAAAVAAHAVVSQVMLLPHRAFEILGYSGGSLVAAHLGERRFGDAAEQHRAMLTVGVGLAAGVTLLLLSARGQLAASLAADGRIAELAGRAFVFAALALVPIAVYVLAYATLTAAGDVRLASVVLIGSSWVVLVPLAVLLVFLLHQGVVGIWQAEVANSVVLAAVMLARLRRGHWLQGSLAEPWSRAPDHGSSSFSGAR